MIGDIQIAISQLAFQHLSLFFNIEQLDNASRV